MQKIFLTLNNQYPLSLLGGGSSRMRAKRALRLRVGGWYSIKSKNHFLLGRLLLSLLILLLITPFGYTKKEKETVATIDVMQPAALVDQFIGLVQYPPPSPFLLDLQGLESQRQITSPAMLSPNKSWLAASQVTLLPETYETLTQVLITPIGPVPKLDEYIWPRVLMDYNSRQFNKNKRKN